MKLATVRIGNQERVVALTGDGRSVVDLKSAAQLRGRALPWFESMLTMIEGGQEALEEAQQVVRGADANGGALHALTEVRLLAPIPVPRQVRDVMSFPLHITQAMRGRRVLNARLKGHHAEAEKIALESLPELPAIYRKQPIFYITNRFSVRGDGHTVEWPAVSSVMDYELELAVVIGKQGANLSSAAAKESIFGYTIFNDFSARDVQGIEMEGRLGPSKGKSFDGGNIFGPWIVTADEMPDPYTLKMSARVNGETRCSATTEGMLFSFEEVVAYVSRDETVMPGEIICSGTVGNGCELERGSWLNDGDVVELEAENIGVLRNSVKKTASSID